MSISRLMRRLLASLFITALIAGACARADPEPGVSEPTMGELAAKTRRAFELLVAPGDLTPGTNRLVLRAMDSDGTLIGDLDLELWLARDEDSPAEGPVPVTFADEGLGDKAFYRATADLESPGNWLILVVREDDKASGAGATVEVKDESPVPKVGDEAPAVPTPTFEDHLGVKEICTRDPQDPMHEVSLDEALGTGRPIVLVIATPAYCTSAICGPVVDQILEVREQHEADAHFIHVEVFQDRDAGEYSGGFQAFNLRTEPWTFVIDSEGVIQARFEGPVTPSEVDEALESVL